MEKIKKEYTVIINDLTMEEATDLIVKYPGKSLIKKNEKNRKNRL
tara:strand:+ start:467 stop:601 length:135 start_codon:yes stop_codon:yes gene_type:complete